MPSAVNFTFSSPHFNIFSRAFRALEIWHIKVCRALSSLHGYQRAVLILSRMGQTFLEGEAKFSTAHPPLTEGCICSFPHGNGSTQQSLVLCQQIPEKKKKKKALHGGIVLKTKN